MDNKNQPTRHTYDADGTALFLARAFSRINLEQEQIMTWAVTDQIIGKPVDTGTLIKKMRRTTKPTAFYVSTMSVRDDAELRNTQKGFAGLHFVVLDDIGTKIDPTKLPPDLLPNAIIETSKGNEQWFFFLDEPIRDLELATAFVRVVYGSGMTDTGGCLPNKMVRLPAGVNGKMKEIDGEKKQCLDKVHLVDEIDPEPWNPADLLDFLDCGVTWDQLKENPRAFTRALSTAYRQGTSPWSPVPLTAPSITGEADPLLEWFYEQDLVQEDPNVEGWVTIQCPWHKEHTSGGDTCGYNAIGYGDNPNRRGYHCFHDHCSGKNITDLIHWAIEQGGPEVAVADDIADLIADYAFMKSGSRVVRLRGVRGMRPHKWEDWKRSIQHRRVFQNFQDPESGKIKCKVRPAADLWLGAPNTLRLTGERHCVTDPSRVIEYDNEYWLNTYEPPLWTTGPYRKDHVKIFLKYLNYLIPEKEERRYVLQWLACKVVNPDFRGCAVLMVTPMTGTGRSTFGDLLCNLMNPANAKEVPFDTIIGAGAGSQYNEWRRNLFIVCPEVWSNDPKVNKYKAMEILKSQIDQRPQREFINTKYGSKTEEDIHSTYLLLSNHTDAIGALGEDRRIYVVRNPNQRKSPDYYEEIRAYFAGNKDGFIQNIYRWLLTVDFDRQMLESPAPETKTKRQMIMETTSPIGRLLEWWGDNVSPLVPASIFRELVYSACAVAEMEVEDWATDRQFSGAFREHTMTMDRTIQAFRLCNGRHRFRVLLSKGSNISTRPELAKKQLAKLAVPLRKQLEDAASNAKLIADMAEVLESCKD